MTDIEKDYSVMGLAEYLVEMFEVKEGNSIVCKDCGEFMEWRSKEQPPLYFIEMNLYVHMEEKHPEDYDRFCVTTDHYPKHELAKKD